MRTLLNGIDARLEGATAAKYFVLPGLVIGALTGACDHGAGPGVLKETAKGAAFGAAGGALVAGLLLMGARSAVKTRKL